MLFKIFLILVVLISYTTSTEIDDKGYILYCPCMGRFGNQAEQLLGTLQFAKALHRTLVLPPFIEYHKSRVDFIPFHTVINVTVLKTFHKVIVIDDFMREIAPIIWKDDNRPVFCYSGRPGKNGEDCNACEGNPFEPFWRQFNITSFKLSIFYGPLSTNYKQASQWIKEYSKFQVITFVGAPSSFPVNKQAIGIQKYLTFSDQVISNGNEYKLQRQLSDPYIGVHLRWGSDWHRTCSLLEQNQMKTLFSSSQCSDGSKLIPVQLCIQEIDLITESLKEIVSKTNLSTIYIASDLDDHDAWQSIFDSLKTINPNVKLFTPNAVYSISKTFFEPTHFLLDLYLLSSSDIFIGNCISSFSAFVSRTRTYSLNKPKEKTSFFGTEFFNNHDEL